MLTGATKTQISAVDRTVWLNLLRCMMRARKTEERLIRLYHQGKIYGGVYTGIGQEAMGAATSIAGKSQDLFAPCIRDMTVHIGRGESVLNIFRQYLARATSPTRGRDGNVHYGNLKNGVYTMISHLGAMIPVVMGGVMARRKKGDDSVGVAYIGDGGTSTGDFHEAVNFAAVFHVPVIILIENNQFAYSTPTRLQYRCERLVDRAKGYGIQGVCTDGNDAVSLYVLARELMEDIRKKPRPILLECETMRMRGHGEHDNFSYVPRELIEKYTEKDPLKTATWQLIKAHILSADEITALENECHKEVEIAYQQALSEPPPDPSTLTQGVYADD